MSPILKGSAFQPAKGGHAPGDVREAFCEAVDAFEERQNGAPEPTVELREQQLPISAIFGLLWNCSDILPGTLWSQLEDVAGHDDLPKRRTYGAGRTLVACSRGDDVRLVQPDGLRAVRVAPVEPTVRFGHFGANQSSVAPA
jgi:hypothetical protein